MRNDVRGITKEEFLTAYRLAAPGVRKEVRRLLAETLRQNGDIEGAVQLLNMED